jgi:chromosome partitioning protein
LARVFSIANQKGGVGKTTTAVNLASCIAATEYKTLIIDMDPQSNTGYGFGFFEDQQRKSIYDLFVKRCSIEETIYPTEVPNLDILPSSKDLIGFEIEFVMEEKREYILKNSIESILPKYQYILIDCPPSLGLLTLNSLASSNVAIVPVQCEYYSLEGLSRLLETIKIVKRSINQQLEAAQILLTMFDGRTNLSTYVENEIRKKFDNRVFKTTIPRNVRLSEAPSFGKPIILYDIKSKGSQAYLKLAKEVISNEKKSLG